MPEAAEEKKRVPRFLTILLTTFVLGVLAFAAVVWYSFRQEESRFSRHPGAYSQFDVSRPIIPFHEVQRGGPSKDDIPALTDPKMIRADAAVYLTDDDRVIGVRVNNEARAYPLRILNHHEIANDRIGGTPVAVTYCPLCDSSAVFDRRDGDRVHEFGVSGLLYNSNVLMYDRGTDSLWSQIMTQGVSGAAAKQSLKTLPMELTTWSDWHSRHPKTLVLSKQTGHSRDYQKSPYQSYFDNSNDLMFPVSERDDRLPPKTFVLGVWTGDKVAKAYPLSAFNEDQTELVDELDGRTIVLRYNPKAKSLRVAEAPDDVQWVYAFWFAWYVFRPETELFAASDDA